MATSGIGNLPGAARNGGRLGPLAPGVRRMVRFRQYAKAISYAIGMHKSIRCDPGRFSGRPHAWGTGVALAERSSGCRRLSSKVPGSRTWQPHNRGATQKLECNENAKPTHHAAATNENSKIALCGRGPSSQTLSYDAGSILQTIHDEVGGYVC